MLSAHGDSSTPQNDETLEAIELLHSFCEPAETIARKLHLPVADIRHAIKHGDLPRRQLELRWEADR